MKQISFLAVLALFLNFSLVSCCSSKKAEQSQGTVEESVDGTAEGTQDTDSSSTQKQSD